MNYSKLYHWINRKLDITMRLKKVAITYLIFFMISSRKHSFTAAAEFSKSSKSRFSKFLKHHSDLAAYKLDELSKKQSKQFAKSVRLLADGKLPWKIAILITQSVKKKKVSHIFQQLSLINGAERLKIELQKVLECPQGCQILI